MGRVNDPISDIRHLISDICKNSLHEFLLGRLDSNQGMQESKSCDLPLVYAPLLATLPRLLRNWEMTSGCFHNLKMRIDFRARFLLQGCAMNPFIVLKLVLPSLILVSLFSVRAYQRMGAYEEIYGDGEHYLRLQYEANPNGLLRKDQEGGELGFIGVWATRGGESFIQGRRTKDSGRYHYEFLTAEGVFQAYEVPSPGRCESGLAYSLGLVKQGVLLPGFCNEPHSTWAKGTVASPQVEKL